MALALSAEPRHHIGLRSQGSVAQAATVTSLIELSVLFTVGLSTIRIAKHRR